jgi:hypothetical protein
LRLEIDNPVDTAAAHGWEHPLYKFPMLGVDRQRVQHSVTPTATVRLAASAIVKAVAPF